MRESVDLSADNVLVGGTGGSPAHREKKGNRFSFQNVFRGYNEGIDAARSPSPTREFIRERRAKVTEAFHDFFSPVLAKTKEDLRPKSPEPVHFQKEDGQSAVISPVFMDAYNRKQQSRDDLHKKRSVELAKTDIHNSSAATSTSPPLPLIPVNNVNTITETSPSPTEPIKRRRKSHRSIPPNLNTDTIEFSLPIPDVQTRMPIPRKNSKKFVVLPENLSLPNRDSFRLSASTSSLVSTVSRASYTSQNNVSRESLTLPRENHVRGGSQVSLARSSSSSSKIVTCEDIPEQHRTPLMLEVLRQSQTDLPSMADDQAKSSRRRGIVRTWSIKTSINILGLSEAVKMEKRAKSYEAIGKFYTDGDEDSNAFRGHRKQSSFPFLRGKLQASGPAEPRSIPLPEFSGVTELKKASSITANRSKFWRSTTPALQERESSQKMDEVVSLLEFLREAKGPVVNENQQNLKRGTVNFTIRSKPRPRMFRNSAPPRPKPSAETLTSHSSVSVNTSPATPIDPSLQLKSSPAEIPIQSIEQLNKAKPVLLSKPPLPRTAGTVARTSISEPNKDTAPIASAHSVSFVKISNVNQGNATKSANTSSIAESPSLFKIPPLPNFNRMKTSSLVIPSIVQEAEKDISLQTSTTVPVDLAPQRASLPYRFTLPIPKIPTLRASSPLSQHTEASSSRSTSVDDYSTSHTSVEEISVHGVTIFRPSAQEVLKDPTRFFPNINAYCSSECAARKLAEHCHETDMGSWKERIVNFHSDCLLLNPDAALSERKQKQSDSSSFSTLVNTPKQSLADIFFPPSPSRMASAPPPPTSPTKVRAIAIPAPMKTRSAFVPSISDLTTEEPEEDTQMDMSPPGMEHSVGQVIGGTQGVGFVAGESDGEPIRLTWVRGQKLGSGAFGTVYVAMSKTTSELMAVKQVNYVTPRIPGIKEQTRQKVVDALHREIALLKDLNHPNVVKYYGYDVTDSTVSIFLEYVDGGSVASVMNRIGPFPKAMTQSITLQVLKGLVYLHERLIIHRDIKGGNILLTSSGMAKIADFGISKKSEQGVAYRPDSKMSFRGSVPWMAPEVVRPNGYSAKVDVWSLGCLVLEMLTGRLPWMQPKGNRRVSSLGVMRLDENQIIYQLGSQHAPPIPETIRDKDSRDFLQSCMIINAADRPEVKSLIKHAFITSFQPEKFDFVKTYETAIRIRTDKMNSPVALVADADEIDDDLDDGMDDSMYDSYEFGESTYAGASTDGMESLHA